MTKEQVYLKVAEKYFTNLYDDNDIDFVCIDVKRLLFGKKGSCQDFITKDKFSELFLFSVHKNTDNYYVWMTSDDMNTKENMEIKGWALLFAIEILKDEKKVQKKSKTRNLR